MNEINIQDVSFVEIETLDSAAELTAESVCACGCGMCICIVLDE
jgi:hypothetical protein